MGADVPPGPLPGDPEALAQDAAMYARTADAINEAIARVGQLRSDAFRSDAVESLHDARDGVVGDVTRAFARYRAAGDALTTYAGFMRDAHDQADAAIRAWHDAEGQLQQLAPAVADATQRAQAMGPEQALAASDLARLGNDEQLLQSAKQAAVAQWSAAWESQKRAASNAAIHIHRGNESGDLDDDIWDDIGDLVDVLNIVNAFVREVLKIVSLVMTILAIVFAIASIFFQPFAAVAAALFGYAQLVNLAIALLALLQFMMDGFHLMDLVVVGIAVVAAFGGAVVGKVLGAATNAAVSTALSGISEGAAKAAGAAASTAVTTAVKEVTDEAVGEILELGSSDAQALYDDLGPAAGGFLSTQLAGSVDAATGVGKDIGGWIGQDFKDGIAATGLPDVAQAGVATAGHVLAPVYDGIADAAKQIDSNLHDAQTAVRETSDSVVKGVTGGLTGVTDQGNRIGSDLSSVFGAPEVGDQVAQFVTGLEKSALGALPGIGVVSQATGVDVGDLAQSMQKVAASGGAPVSAAGGSR